MDVTMRDTLRMVLCMEEESIIRDSCVVGEIGSGWCFGEGCEGFLKNRGGPFLHDHGLPVSKQIVGLYIGNHQYWNFDTNNNGHFQKIMLLSTPGEWAEV
jgi:hypothetical protein